MAIPAPAGVAASGTPPAGDQANAVLSGSFTAIHPSNPFAFLGTFNIFIWGNANTALTTTANSNAFSVVSGTGLAIGQGVNSVNVPRGTTILTFSGTSGTFAFPPNFTSANVIGGTDAAAIFDSVAWAGTVQVERSFNGGKTWLVCGVGGAGQGAIYTGSTLAGQAVSITAAEPERNMLYRLNCVAYTSGTINYRISTTGAAATAWGIPPS